MSQTAPKPRHHKTSFWLALLLVLDFFLFNLNLSDTSPWVFKIAPTLKGVAYPHLSTALVIYLVSAVFITVAFLIFSGFCLRFVKYSQSIPDVLKGYWLLSLVAFSTIIVSLLSFKFTQLRDIRIGATLNLLFTGVFLVTGLLINSRSKE